MFLHDTSAQLLRDGTLQFSLPGFERTRFVMSPWHAGLKTSRIKRGKACPTDAWSIVVLPSGDNPPPRNPAVETFIAGIPAAVQRLIEPYQFGQCLLLRAMAGLKQAEDLIESNAHLLWVMALRVYENRIAANEIANLCNSKQVDVLRALTGTGTKAQVKFLRKVQLEEGTLTEARVLYEALCSSEVVHAVRHLQIVPLNLLSLLTTYPQLARDEFVPLIAAKLAEVEQGDRYRVPALRQQLGDLARITSELRAEDLRDALEHAAAAEDDLPRLLRVTLRSSPSPEHVLDETFPPPPLAGTKDIVPITTFRELEAEGRIQQNCALTRAPSIRSRESYLYRVLAPQRATLEIDLDEAGKPKLGQFKLARNANPSAASWASISTWLASERSRKKAPR